MDNFNQKDKSFGAYGVGTVKDQVSGFTFTGIEAGLLKNVYGVSSLSKNLKANKPAGITDSQIDELLANF